MQKHSTNHRLLSPVCAYCTEMAVRHRQTFSLPGSLITYSLTHLLTHLDWKSNTPSGNHCIQYLTNEYPSGLFVSLFLF